jgi:hypothetical protein
MPTPIDLSARKFALGTIDWSVNLYAKTFHLHPVEKDCEEIREFIEDITGDQNVNYVSIPDNAIKIVPEEELIDIFDAQKKWLADKPYIKEYWDCDDYAYLTRATFPWWHKINCGGIVHGMVNIGHFWNGVPCIHNNELLLYYYDGMRGYYKKHIKNTPIIINGWHYKPDSYRF